MVVSEQPSPDIYDNYMSEVWNKHLDVPLVLGEAPVSSPPPMDHLAKAESIQPWVDPEERVTINFQDASNLNAEVISCTKYVVELGLETFLPHYRQKVVVPLREVTISTDPGRYTRNLDRPFQREATTDH